mmetsp:Transcript_8560/g.27639  ORF Transcript_8560/g.27639 Transcript_8560/m.27639 type:complete len:254 (-) Transcript_8560:445-1206(-)
MGWSGRNLDWEISHLILGWDGTLSSEEHSVKVSSRVYIHIATNARRVDYILCRYTHGHGTALPQSSFSRPWGIPALYSIMQCIAPGWTRRAQTSPAPAPLSCICYLTACPATQCLFASSWSRLRPPSLASGRRDSASPGRGRSCRPAAAAGAGASPSRLRRRHRRPHRRVQTTTSTRSPGTAAGRRLRPYPRRSAARRRGCRCPPSTSSRTPARDGSRMGGRIELSGAQTEQPARRAQNRVRPSPARARSRGR